MSELPRQPCPKGGADHEPFPNGYLSASEYADLLMFNGWEQPDPCPACGLWGLWQHPTPGKRRPKWPPTNDKHLAYVAAEATS